MASRRTMALGMVCALGMLAGCGELPRAEGTPGEDVMAEQDASLSPPVDPYADAVAAASTTFVFNPQNAVGAPDGKVATVLSVLGSVTFDMGQGEEGTGDLRIYYQGLTVALLVNVDFLRGDGSVISSSQVRLLDLGAGMHIAVAPYPGNATPYRYARLKTGVALYDVDAIEAASIVSTPVCGNGQVEASEQCDDGNTTPSDGCSSTCQVEPGYTCEGSPSVCTDIDECADGTAQCAPGETCVNTPGSYTCEPPVCAPPNTVCGTECVDTTSNNAHCGNCETACAANQACVASVCVGSGNLQFVATWSRPGDADLIVTTPTGKTIFFGNPGPPSEATDFGQLDRDDTGGQGPENIFWDTNYTPPSGTYHVCIRVGLFNPAPTPGNPVNVTVEARRPMQPAQTFSKSFTANVFVASCDPSLPSYMGSITYP